MQISSFKDSKMRLLKFTIVSTDLIQKFQMIKELAEHLDISTWN